MVCGLPRPAALHRSQGASIAAAAYRRQHTRRPRIAEISLREVDRGLVEAAQAMGCERRHIVWHVLLPEALPGIIGGFTLTIVSLIGASAMAGAVGWATSPSAMAISVSTRRSWRS